MMKAWFKDKGWETHNNQLIKADTIEFEHEFELQHLSGGFFGSFRNQIPIDQPNIMLSQNDSTINLLERMERNVSIANWKVRRNATNAISKSAANILAKSISQINSTIILIIKRLIQPPSRHKVPSISSAQSLWV